MKRTLTLILTVLMLCTLLFGCGQSSGNGDPQDTNTEPALADGVYTADFNTDSSMFHVNEACEGKGTLTVENGQMTIHISLPSKSILNLFCGTAEDAQKDGAALLQPATDTVTYSDGLSEEVNGFDIPVPALNEEFDVAIIGTKGKWYDHKVSVTNAVLKEDDAAAPAETLADGTAVVECDAADIRAVAGQAGDFTLPVTGFAAGDSAITVTCTYTYLENGVPKRIQSSTIISARSLRDAVGLVYDVEEDTVLRTTVNGVYLPCEGTGSTEGGDVTAPDFERQTGSLYLFAGNAYTDLNDFTVDLSGLTAVDSGGNALDGTRWAIYAGDVIEADDYRYRLLTVETDQPRRLYISGTVTLRRNGVTYQLTLTNYPCGADPAP